MNRRKFLIGASVSTVSIATAGFAWTQLSNASRSLTIESAINFLDAIDVNNVSMSGHWGLSRVFLHCAQSVECSMISFPVHNSALFQSTVGITAFAMFKANGSMTHDKSEEIPGLNSNQPKIALSEAILLLKQMLIKFKNYNGILKPHFAYGELNKRDYEIAHVMHLLDHCSEITQNH